MCNDEEFVSVEYKLLHDLRLSNIKVYQELIHDILSYIPRQTFDDMSLTTRIR